MNKLSNCITDMNATREKYKVAINPLTENPTKAWDKLKVKQTVKSVNPLDPETPITPDKMRFVFLSDTHSLVEKTDSFVPEGDILLHAGDFTQVGHPQAVAKFDTFLGQLSHKAKIVIAGNHDISMDMELIKNRRDHVLLKFGLKESDLEHSLDTLNVQSSRELLKHAIYLEDSSIDICGIKIYGSPWQPEFCDWAFNLPRGKECLKKWDLIPDNTNILLTHGPPIGHGDLCSSGLRAGCVELLETIQNRVKPKFHLFGHVHEGYGITTDGQTTFINGSNCTLRYKLENKPIVFDFPIPEGHTKSELDCLPVNNLEIFNH
ncbi:metallophosphoesterase mpped2 [Biomphalaria glabrata]|nr:metallophosphoesterase MPPED2-like [Biomphalaria glabrata]XP_055860511.1 metallophosphoesterase MPPED2-like [Biomphalaria glabrata]XP_055860512.1 metallophosphoesterase MPPED2-like [Biomphalaria glabrata]XP_055860513.1 metallophosphoesterase MPPED2-like [Biomphalaria glabrata]XP_055860514.1 metallophosphoesterase MPPED2-like [Biomphalaria glabrata]KAI8730244.1 metallophosphoesterase MPPED2 [Biomphalaria glabrata]KAI8778427.1 metallophosphoesterase MPPED2 [Biomphalaria glabrata]